MFWGLINTGSVWGISYMHTRYTLFLSASMLPGDGFDHARYFSEVIICGCVSASLIF